MAQQHIVQTTHIQRLIENGLLLARSANGSAVTCHVMNERRGATPRTTQPIDVVPIEHALQKAAADLRHAAEELEAERLSCLGWAQV